MNNKHSKPEIFLNGWARLKGELLTLFIKWGFGSFGKGSIIYKPLRIDGMPNIYVGDKVIIRHLSWFYVQETDAAKLTIGNGCYLGHSFHCAAIDDMVIGEKVLIADKVFLSDNTHGFQNVSIPYMENPIEVKGKVSIGDGSWIGENVCILGAKVGSHCIIGANSVVTSDIPDYSIAVGIPARVVKKFDHGQQKWVKAQL